MTGQFDAYSQYYDLLYEDKDYDAEANYVAALLRRFRSGVRKILELGCGTGNHAKVLAEDGFDVHGIEISDSMLARASTRAEALRISDAAGGFVAQKGDVRDFRAGVEFDAAISLFHVVSYQTSNDDVNRMFATVDTHLKPGGIFLFDVWYGPAVCHTWPSVRVKRMKNDKVDVRRIAEPSVDPNANRVDVNYEISVSNKSTGKVTTFTETHPMRYYFTPEIAFLANVHQLSIVHSEEWLTGRSPSEKTWGVTFVLRKEPNVGVSQ